MRCDRHGSMREHTCGGQERLCGAGPWVPNVLEGRFPGRALLGPGRHRFTVAGSGFGIPASGIQAWARLPPTAAAWFSRLVTPPARCTQTVPPGVCALCCTLRPSASHPGTTRASVSGNGPASALCSASLRSFSLVYRNPVSAKKPAFW